MSLLDLAVPGLGTVISVLTEILKLCQELKEGQDACTQAHKRLAAIFSELEKMKERSELPPSESLAKYAGIVGQFLIFMRAYSELKLVSRLVQHSAMMKKLHHINEDIDMLFKMLNLASTAAMVDWRNQWEADRLAQERAMTTLVTNSATVLDEVRDVRSQLEALSTLKYEIERNAEHQTKEMLKTMKMYMRTIVRASSVKVEALPPWFLPRDAVTFDPAAFARGSFGSVHRGVWGPGTKVVVKCLTVDESAIGTKAHNKVLAEINIWHQLNHPNVIKMFGASHVSSPPFIVCEKAPYGNLFEFLSKSEENSRWMWRLLYQAALGLQYIHGMKVVHGDLKLNNILVGAEHTAKLADFGLSAVRTSSALSRATASGATPESGGLHWRAPECLKNRPTFASDVYSFAMCIIEAVSGETPFGFLSDDDVRFNLSRGEIPDRLEGISDEAWTLVIGMTNTDTRKRTPLTDVITQMKAFADAEDAAGVEEDTELCSECYTTVPSAATFCSSCGVRLKSSGHAVFGRTSSSGSLAEEKDEEESAGDSVNGDGDKSTNSGVDDNVDAATNESLIEDARGPLGTQQPTVASDCMSNRAEELDYSGPYTPLTREAIMAMFTVLIDGNEQQQITAARALAQVSDDDNNNCYLTVGGISVSDKMRTSDGKNEMKAMAVSTLKNTTWRVDNTSAIKSATTIRDLVALVDHGSDDQKTQAALVLRAFCRIDEHRQAVALAGAIPPLVALIERGTDKQKEIAADSLADLGFFYPSQDAIISVGGIPAFVALVRDGTVKQKVAATQAMIYLASNDSNRASITSAGGIPPLIALVRDGYGNGVGKWRAVSALEKLALYGSSSAAIASAGGIPPLVALARDGSDLDKENAVRALANLAMCEANKAVIVSAGGIPPLVALVRGGNTKQKTNAADALQQLAVTNDNKVTIASAGGIPPLVALVRDGNDEQKTSAAGSLQQLATIDENRAEIASSGGIPPLVTLVRVGNDEQKTNAVGALQKLAVFDDTGSAIASAGGIPPLIALVRDGNDEQKEAAADALQKLATNDENGSVIVSAGGIPLLIALVRDGNDKQKFVAAGALQKLAVKDENGSAIVSAGGIPPLVALVRDGNNEQKEPAAHALGTLAAKDANKVMIASEGGIPPLVVMVRDGNDEQKLVAADALHNLAGNEASRTAISSAGGISPLVALVRSGDNEQKEFAARALQKLAVSDENKAEIASQDGIPPLIALVRGGNDKQKFSAVDALQQLAINDGNKVTIASLGGIPPLVVLLRDGNGKQKEFAAGALRNLAVNGANKTAIASAGGIPPLVALVGDGNDRQKLLAAGALGNLAVNDANKAAIATAGGVPPLTALARDGSNEHKKVAAYALDLINAKKASEVVQPSTTKPPQPLVTKYALLIGLSGSGKSTFINSVAGILVCSSGDSNGAGWTRQCTMWEHQANRVKYVDTPANPPSSYGSVWDVIRGMGNGDLCHVLFFATIETGHLMRHDVETMKKVKASLDLQPGSYSLVVNKVSQEHVLNTSSASSVNQYIRGTLGQAGISPAEIILIPMFQHLVGASDQWFQPSSDMQQQLLRMRFVPIKKPAPASSNEQPAMSPVFNSNLGNSQGMAGNFGNGAGPTSWQGPRVQPIPVSTAPQQSGPVRQTQNSRVHPAVEDGSGRVQSDPAGNECCEKMCCCLLCGPFACCVYPHYRRCMYGR